MFKSFLKGLLLFLVITHCYSTLCVEPDDWDEELDGIFKIDDCCSSDIGCPVESVDDIRGWVLNNEPTILSAKALSSAISSTVHVFADAECKPCSIVINETTISGMTVEDTERIYHAFTVMMDFCVPHHAENNFAVASNVFCKKFFVE